MGEGSLCPNVREIEKREERGEERRGKKEERGERREESGEWVSCVTLTSTLNSQFNTM